MLEQVAALARELLRNLRDLLPIVCVVALFQVVVIGEPMPELGHRAGGALMALVGMTLFVRGLAMSLFPLGDAMAESLARRGSLLLLLAFAFALGFGSTFAEPALSAVADQAAEAAAAAGSLDGQQGEVARFSLLLRYAVAFSAGLGVAAGVLRLVKGWPVVWFVLPGYAVASILVLSSSSPLAAMAFDAGAAATSAINIPLMLALGVGLAAMIRERNALVDGFGIVAMASLTPTLVVLAASFFIG